MILSSLPVGFLPDARSSCFESQLFQQEEKKKVPEGKALVLPVTLLLPRSRIQAHETAHEKGLQQQEAKAEGIRLDQNKEAFYIHVVTRLYLHWVVAI